MSDLSALKRLSASSAVTATCVLALLHFGREVLEPLALAAVLSLVIAPLIRSLGRLGFGRMSATLTSVVLVAACVVGVSVVLAFQLVAVTRDLPHYRAAIRSKVEKVREVTERPFARMEAELGALAPQISGSDPTPTRSNKIGANPAQPVPVEIRPPRMTTRDTLARLAALAWGPIGEAGLVLVLLVFILLEHESLRDRMVRLAGQSGISRTIKALADAAQGVSRFFFSQFVVNVTFGLIVGSVLWAVGVPHAVLWGALSGLLRFVPYLGVLAAGSVIAVFVAAIDPGWTLALSCMALFVSLELLVANIIEPKVYGHSSGLSPLAVIVSALFWGALWGPVGLLLSTPLTLCLVVAGRHVRALEPVTILLGDAPNVPAAQRFYQRAISGDSGAIIHDARAYLRKYSFARYCDQILFPGLALATADRQAGAIEKSQQERMRISMAEVTDTLTPVVDHPAKSKGSRKVSLLDAGVGAHLRQVREAHLGRWQGPLDVPAHSVVLCAGFPTQRDDLLTELLVRSLREGEMDARSILVEVGHDTERPERTDLVFAVFIAYPLEASLAGWVAAVAELRERYQEALLVTVRLSIGDAVADQSIVEKHVDMVLRSYEEALAFVEPHRPAARS